MHHRLVVAAILATLTSSTVHAQTGPAFTYQGDLQASGVPATGLYDLKFRLYSVAVGGSAVAAELCADNITVSNGRFAVELDFGVLPLNESRFLEVDVRPDAGLGCGAGAGYTTLGVRQKLTAAPYAGAALSAADAGSLAGLPPSFYLNAANLTGTIADARLSANVSLRGSTNTFTGANTFSNAGNSFTGSGSGLTGLSASNLASGTVADARLSSNVALRSAANAFSGINSFSNPSNMFAGNGAALTALNASAMTTGTVAEARLPALTGDVSGSYANNRVTQLRGVPLSSAVPSANQVLRFDGTQWLPAADQTSTAGSGLTQTGSQLSIAPDGVVSTMLAADPLSIRKITESRLSVSSDALGRTGLLARTPGAATPGSMGVLTATGGDSSQLVLRVEGTDAASILLRAGRGVSDAIAGGFVDIEAGNGSSGGRGGLFSAAAGTGSTPSTDGSGGDGGDVLISAGTAGLGRNSNSGTGGDIVLIAGGSGDPIGTGSPGTGGSIHLNRGAGLSNGGVAINIPTGTPLNANLRIRGDGTLGRVVLESGGADQVSELLFSENTSNTNGVYLREDGVANALQVIDLTAGAETQIAAFDRDTNGFSAGVKAFKIDHPLDPTNKFLYHSCVESPDMMNIYNGNIVTDAEGYATVELPAYFDALNRDFRYQLTVLDDSEDFVLAKVVRKIGDAGPNRFTLRTSRGGVEVSWMVTGVRRDALAEKHRIVPEVDKPAAQKGKLLHPDAFEPSARD